MNAEEARKILARSLKPRETEVDLQVGLAEKKIRIACALKYGECVFSVISEMKTKEETYGLTIVVAHALKDRGFDIKIKNNQIKIKWKSKDEES